MTFKNVKAFPDVDIKSEGGMIVCAGSLHPDGGYYEMDPKPYAKLSPASIKKIRAAQEAYAAQTAKGGAPKGQHTKRGKALLPGISHGKRILGDPKHGEHTIQLNKALFWLRTHFGYDEEQLDRIAHKWNEDLTEPASENAIRKAVKSAAKAEPPNHVHWAQEKDRTQVRLPDKGVEANFTAEEVGIHCGDEHKANRNLGTILSRYRDRKVGDKMFVIEGKHAHRRYIVYNAKK